MNRIIKACFLAVVIAAPTVIALLQMRNTVVDAPIVAFTLGFDYFSLVFPLLAVAVYVVGFSSKLSHGWISSVRTRTDIGAYLTREALRNAAMSFAVFFAAVMLLAVVAFGVLPVIGAIPNFSPEVLSDEAVRTLTMEYSTFTQLAQASVWLYAVVYAAWVGVWGAVFSTLAFVTLLFTGNRLVAFFLPIVLYWVENIVLSLAGLEVYRAVTSAFPFSITQQPIGFAAVPLVWWFVAAGLLEFLVVRRRFETAALT